MCARLVVLLNIFDVAVDIPGIVITPVRSVFDAVVAIDDCEVSWR